MSILPYLKRRCGDVLPDPGGELSRSIPLNAISSANRHVAEILKRTKRPRGKYNSYTPELRAEIGKVASQIGIKAAAIRFTKRLGKHVNESTVRSIRKAYREALLIRRKSGKAKDGVLSSVHPKKRGKPLLLGKKIDAVVQEYILKLRECGSPVNSAVVQAVAEGVLLAMDRTSLAQYGGHIKLSNTWEKSLLARMNFTKRKGSTKEKVEVKNFEKIKEKFLQDIVDIATMEEIPSQLIFNWDQTGINLVPYSSWTMEEKGKKRVGVIGLNDKRQITAVLCGSIDGEFFPVQLIYAGKTKRCHPSYVFPEEWNITHSSNHWSNEDTMVEYIQEVIVPYVESVREGLNKPEQAALAIFDNFKGQLTEKVLQELEDNNIQSVLVPANCTDRLQPMDLSVNKSIKSFLRSQFSTWYSQEVFKQMEAHKQQEAFLSNTTDSSKAKQSRRCREYEPENDSSIDTSEADGSSDDTGSSEENHSDEERSQSSDDSGGAEFEPVDVSTAKMKSLGGQWLVKASEYIKSHPGILINRFKAAGITDALGIAIKLTDNIQDYVSEIDSDSDYDELFQGSSGMCVEAVYSTDSDDNDTIVISDDE